MMAMKRRLMKMAVAVAVAVVLSVSVGGSSSSTTHQCTTSSSSSSAAAAAAALLSSNRNRPHGRYGPPQQRQGHNAHHRFLSGQRSQRRRCMPSSSSSLSSSSSSSEMPNPSPLDGLSNLFGAKKKENTNANMNTNTNPPRPPSGPIPAEFLKKFDPTRENLISRAKLVVASDLGLREPSLLSDDFVWIGPSQGSDLLEKQDYLAAGKFFDLRAAFPDLDYRGHDFRLDPNDPLTVRLTARAVGTMRGQLRLRNQVLEPNAERMTCPPEAISMTFDPFDGRVRRMCSGFGLDRFVGNTGGLCGVMAAATIGGSPPSVWETAPPAAIFARFVGRPVLQLAEPTSFLAPFPETVMIQLAKGIFASDMASSDPDLLDPDFLYVEPYLGPIAKDDFVNNYAKLLFVSEEPELSNFRVDPYDPYRVWVDVLPYQGAPQAFSFTFDDDGFCTRITGGAVMDPSVGLSGGLGGVNGAAYTSGKAPLGLASRPLPQATARLWKRITEPITKVGADQYAPPIQRGTGITSDDNTKASKSRGGGPFSSSSPPPPPPAPEQQSAKSALSAAFSNPFKKDSTPVGSRESTKTKGGGASAAAGGFRLGLPPIKVTPSSSSSSRGPPKPRTVGRRNTTKPPPPPPKTIPKQAVVKRPTLQIMGTDGKRKPPPRPPSSLRRPATPVKQTKKPKKPLKTRLPPKRSQTSSFSFLPFNQSPAATKSTTTAPPKPKPPKSPPPPVPPRKYPTRASVAASASKPKPKPLRTMTPPRSQKPKPRPRPPPRRSPPQPRTKARPKPKPSRTFALKLPKPDKSPPSPPPSMATKFGGTNKKTPTAAPVAPRGVPTLRNWRKNRDGSVTGLISGSRQFDENERVTTSIIGRGTIAKGNVVQTMSGSKYFLS